MERFLKESLRDGLVDAETYHRLIRALQARGGPAPSTVGVVLTEAPPRTDVAPLAEHASTPEPVPEVRFPLQQPAPKLEPLLAPVIEKLRLAKELVASEFALHGIAYLGVLLVFAGTLGFVIFAFGGVRVGLRPVAELVIPAVLFGSAWFLRRRGAPFVADALEVLAGAVTPVIVLASFRDAAAVPPDLDRAALILVWMGASLALMTAYAFVALRRPESPLRFLVAPLLWLAVWVLGLGIRGEVSAAQMALASVAVAVTAGAVRVRPGIHFARAAETGAIPAAGLTFGLTVLFAAAKGWPAVSLAVAGAATIVAIEAFRPRLGDGLVAPISTSAVLAITMAALIPALGLPWVGLVAVLAYLAQFERLGRGSWPREASIVALAGVAVGLALSVAEPWAMVSAWGAASVWAHVRRAVMTRASPDWAILLERAATWLPAGVGAGLALAMPIGRAALAAALVLVGVRILTAILVPDDEFYRGWVTWAAGLVVLATLPAHDELPAVSAGLVPLALAAGICGVLLVAPPQPVVRIYAGATAFAWSLALTLERLQLAPSTQLAVWSLVGLVAVLAEIPWRREEAGHIAAIGHLAGLGTLVALAAVRPIPPDATRLLVLSAWAAAWAATAILDDLRAAPVVQLVQRTFGGDRAVAWTPAVVLAVSLPFVVVTAGGATGVLTGHRAWTGVVLGFLAFLYGAGGRMLRTRTPLARVLVAGAPVLSVVAIAVAAPEPWPLIAAIGAGIGTVAITRRAWRPRLSVWFAWLLATIEILLLANRAGVPVRSLHLVLFGVGAVALVGGLLLDDVWNGRRPPGDGLRTAWLVHPVAVGALAVPAGLAFTFSGPPEVFGSWCIAAAVLYAIVAWRLRAGAVSVVTWALLVFGAEALSPWSPLDRPVLLVPVVALLIAVAWTLKRATSEEATAAEQAAWLRWDLAPLIVAHGVAAAALARSIGVDGVPVTWAGIGALSFVVVVWRRAWPWLAGGTALVLIGAGVAGPGWLALALGATAAGCTEAARRRGGPLRVSLQAASVTAAGWAWIELLLWSNWTMGRAVLATGLAAGAIVLTVALLARFARLGIDWTTAWGGLGVLGSVAVLFGQTFVGRSRGGSAASVAALMLALACAVAARPTGWARLRESSAVAALVAVGEIGYRLDLSRPMLVQLFIATGLLGSLAALALLRVRPASPWIVPSSGVSIGANVAAVSIAITTLPRRDLLVESLLAAAVQCGAVSLVTRRRQPLYAAPVLACAAWLLFATEALVGRNAQWLTMPIGLTLLALVCVLRSDLRARERPLGEPVVVILEALGIAFLAGASLVETITRGMGYGLIAVFVGAGVVAWGALSKVRRRVLAGAVVTVGALFLMIAVPAAHLVPRIRGVVLWITIAAVGVALIVVAAMLERGRTRLSAAMHHVDELMEGWE